MCSKPAVDSGGMAFGPSEAQEPACEHRQAGQGHGSAASAEPASCSLAKYGTAACVAHKLSQGCREQWPSLLGTDTISPTSVVLQAITPEMLADVSVCSARSAAFSVYAKISATSSSCCMPSARSASRAEPVSPPDTGIDPASVDASQHQAARAMSTTTVSACLPAFKLAANALPYISSDAFGSGILNKGGARAGVRVPGEERPDHGSVDVGIAGAREDRDQSRARGQARALVHDPGVWVERAAVGWYEAGGSNARWPAGSSQDVLPASDAKRDPGRAGSQQLQTWEGAEGSTELKGVRDPEWEWQGADQESQRWWQAAAYTSRNWHADDNAAGWQSGWPADVPHSAEAFDGYGANQGDYSRCLDDSGANASDLSAAGDPTRRRCAHSFALIVSAMCMLLAACQNRCSW
jgi:hypothetical protein